MTAETSHRRALVVEDDAAIAASIGSLLREQLGVADVVVAGTFAAARTAIAAEPFDLVLLDLVLPDGSGFDVMTALESQPTRPLIVVITMFDDDDKLFEALRRGTDGYILKEESGAEFARLLEEIVSGRPPLSPSIARRILEQFREPAGNDPELELTERELEVLRLLARGNTVARAAKTLDLSTHTVQHHVKNLYSKLGVHSRASMTRRALELGLVK